MSAVKFDKRLASILVKRGKLDKETITEAVTTAEESGDSLSKVLIEKEYVAENDLLVTLAEETNIPPINAEKITPDESVVQLLPENLANYYQVIPVTRIGNLLTLAVSNPFDILKLDDIQIVTGCTIRPVLSTDVTIRAVIPEVYNRGQEMVQDLLDNMDDPELDIQEARDDADEFQLDGEDGDQAPVVKLVNLIVYEGIQKKASDIHIEPMEKNIQVRYRIDGVCRVSITPPKKMQNAIASRLKIMCGLDIAERRKPQDGKFQLKIHGRQIDFRVSTLPCIHGEKIVLRILDSSNLTLNLDALDFEKKCLEDIRTAIKQPFGMTLVTGPTGSGKSTTLYSCIREVLSPDDNIVTVEDPVEYQLDGVNQVQVNVKRGLTFAAALRSILRQDPDTILLGEIRDQETITIAVKAALTGHLVFSTLHTNDAPSTITRMIDMDVDPFLVASSVMCVCAQRLGKRLCPDCKRPLEANPPPERLIELGFQEEELEGIELYEKVGCPRCAAGYKGRFAILETMPLNEELRRVIIEGGSALDIKAVAMEQGMYSLRRVGLLNAGRGKTSIEEILRVTVGDG